MKTTLINKCELNINLPYLHLILSIDEFRSKVACENDVIQLMCNPYSRIAIYGATYGKTGDESLQCQQPSQTSKDESESQW